MKILLEWYNRHHPHLRYLVRIDNLPLQILLLLESPAWIINTFSNWPADEKQLRYHKLFSSLLKFSKKIPIHELNGGFIAHKF